MTEKWKDALGRALHAHGLRRDEGGGPGEALLPLFSLESGTRLALDGEGACWALPPEGEATLARASPGILLEAVEQKRDALEARLEEAARGLGLDPERTLAAFPFLEVARAGLAASSSYVVRLTLLWLAPTELRPLRDAIAAVGARPGLPRPVRDLAARLLVPT